MIAPYNAQQYRHKALQDPRELNEFCALIRREGVSSYLEIGCKHGGSLWQIANQLPKGSTIVAVDLPHGDESFKNSRPNLEACCKDLKAAGYKVHLFLGDSTDKAIVDKVAAFALFDLCFIDANHTTKYVWADWTNYGTLARMVAFHDINQVDKDWGAKMPIQVKAVWNELKQRHRHKEFCYCNGVNGIGVLWNP